MDPDVFGPLGPGSVIISTDPNYINKQKKVRKTLISTVLWLLFEFLSLKTDVNVPTKSNKRRNLGKNALKDKFMINSEK